mgnify:CR=1 FL=1
MCCKYCGNEVSKDQDYCPKCGKNLKVKRNISSKSIILICLGLVICLIVVSSLFILSKMENQNDKKQIMNVQEKDLYTRYLTLYLLNVPEKYIEKSTNEIDTNYKQKIENIFLDENLLNDILVDMEYDLDVNILKERIQVDFVSGTLLVKVSVQDDNEYRADFLCDLLNKKGKEYLKEYLNLEVNIVSFE